jgi:hypothetical protein
VCGPKSLPDFTWYTLGYLCSIRPAALVAPSFRAESAGFSLPSGAPLATDAGRRSRGISLRCNGRRHSHRREFLRLPVPAPAQNQKRRRLPSVVRAGRMTPRSPVHRRRFFFTPTGTCANPTPRVKIFSVSSDCAPTRRSGESQAQVYLPPQAPQLAISMLPCFVKIPVCRNALAHNERTGGYCADSAHSTFPRTTSLNATTGLGSLRFTKRAIQFSCAKIMPQRSASPTITASRASVRSALNRVTAPTRQKMAIERILRSLLSRRQALPP